MNKTNTLPLQFIKLVMLLGMIQQLHSAIENEEENFPVESLAPKQQANIAREGEQQKPNEKGAPSSPAEKTSEKTIYLNFENASLASVVNYLAEKKDINLLPHKDLEAQQVSLTTQEALTIEEAWNILLTLLEVNNFSIVEVGDLHRIVPTTASKQEPLPTYFGVEPEKLPENDLQIRYIYLFRNIRAETVKGILDLLLGENKVQFNADLNACIISEKSFNIKAAMKIITELDMGGLRESIQIVRLREANAEEVEKLFTEQLLGGGEEQRPMRFLPQQQKKQVTYFSSDTKIISEPRNNNLILLGTKNNLDRIRTFIGKYIDVPLDAPQSRLHIKELKYADAEKLAPLLVGAIEPPIKDIKSPLAGKFKFFEDMLIIAEPSTEKGEGEEAAISLGSGNRLLIACNRDDWRRIEKFIDKLDKPQPQVAIEVLFVDHSLSAERELSAQVRNKKPGQIGTHVNTQTHHISKIDPKEASQFNILNENFANIIAGQVTENASWLTLGRNTTIDSDGNTILDKLGLWAVAKAVLRTDNLNIIQQPFLVAINHEKTILLLDDLRRARGEIDVSTVTGIRKDEDVSAKVTVEMTPSINADGNITIHIKIDLDEFREEIRSGIDVPDRRTRLIETKSSLNDGEVLIVGGVTQNITVEDIRKTPILGDIPIIGNLFRGRNSLTEKRALYIFIRPTLIKPRFEGRPGNYTQLKLDYAKIAVGRSAAFLSTKDPIQRWFFNTEAQKPMGTLVSPHETAAEKEYNQIDDFTQAKQQPRSTKIAQDPYYKTRKSRTIQARSSFIQKRREELRKLKGRKRTLKKGATP